jgi:hypothetical protein
VPGSSVPAGRSPGCADHHVGDPRRRSDQPGKPECLRERLRAGPGCSGRRRDRLGRNSGRGRPGRRVERRSRQLRRLRQPRPGRRTRPDRGAAVRRPVPRCLPDSSRRCQRRWRRYGAAGVGAHHAARRQPAQPAAVGAAGGRHRSLRAPAPAPHPLALITRARRRGGASSQVTPRSAGPHLPTRPKGCT